MWELRTDRDYSDRLIVLDTAPTGNLENLAVHVVYYDIGLLICCLNFCELSS